MNGYRVLRKLGSGGFAEVFHVTKNGRDYAIKSFKDTAGSRVDSIEREVDYLRQVSNLTCVTGLVEAFIEGNDESSRKIHIVSEIAENGNPFQYMANYGGLPGPIAKNYVN